MTSNHHSFFACLRLNGNPFIPIPPIASYETAFRSRFSARASEVEEICRCASDPRAVFVVAPYGGGKTVVLLEALARLREAGFSAFYGTFDRGKGFRRSVADAMSNAGMSLDLSSQDILGQVKMAIRQLCAQAKKVVLAVDDLDRAHDIAEVYQVSHDVRELLSESCSVLVTGQPFGVTFDLHTSAGGVFHEVDIPPFTQDDFREMLKNYLRSVQESLDLSPTHPFDEAAANFICREMASAKLTPRLFNFAAAQLIDHAAREKISSIPLATVFEHWPSVAEKVVRGLQELQIRHLQVILREGVVSENTDDAITELGEDVFAEFPEVQNEILRPLVEDNLVSVQKVDGIDEFRLTPHAATAIADRVGLQLKAEDRESLLKMWAACQHHSDGVDRAPNVKSFAAEFFGVIPGFSVPDDRVTSCRKQEELDVFIEIIGHEHHTRYGTLAVCACRGWDSPVSGDELLQFEALLTSHSCRFGACLALAGVSLDASREVNRCLSEGLVITLLTPDDFARLSDGDHPAMILRDAYYRTIRNAKDVPRDAPEASRGKATVFICYARADNEDPDPKKCWLDRFLKHTKPFERQLELVTYSDCDIRIGDDWHAHIQEHLAGANAAVLLISPDFLASDYIANNELPPLLKAAVDNGVKFFPILISPCSFSRTKFKYPDSENGPHEFKLSSILSANPPSKTLVEMNEGEQNRVLAKVAEQLADLLERKP